MTRIYVKARTDLKVRHPFTLQHIADEGQWVEQDNYWLRRIADGDVVETTPPAEPKADKK